ncbi:MAG: hypothetical protein MJ072_07170, partial [Clostridia bacterium]|nr:hypothetical protein [Clostridia bacterium]
MKRRIGVMAMSVCLALSVALSIGLFNVKEANASSISSDYKTTAIWNESVGTLGNGGESGKLTFTSVTDEDNKLDGYTLSGTANYYGFESKITYDRALDLSKPVSFYLDANMDTQTGNAQAWVRNKYLIVRLSGTARYNAGNPNVSTYLQFRFWPRWTN